MDDNQENRFTAALQVQDFLEDNASDLAGVAQIAEVKTELDGHIEKYVEADGTATTDTTGSAEEKAAQRAILMSTTLRLSRAAKAWATDTNDIKLLRKVDLVKTDLSQLRDTQFYVACKELNKLITPIIASLAPYLVLPTHLTAQGDALEAYFDTISEPADQSDERQLAGQEADRQLSLIYTLFNTKLDTYMDLLLDDEPELVAEYYLARAITDNAGGSGSGTGGGGTPAPGTGAGTQPIVFSGTVLHMSAITTALFVYKANKAVKLENTGSPMLKFQLQKGGMPAGTVISLNAGEVMNGIFSDLAMDGDSFQISNIDPLSDGNYSITLG